MRFKLKAADLIQALKTVSNVTPKPITPQGGVGYLFKTYRDTEGLPRCFVYSRDQSEVARADIALLELDGEGAFIAPLKLTDGIQYIPDYEIDFDVKADGDTHSVKYRATSPESSSSRPAVREATSFDPRLISPIDKDFEAATQKKTFASGILREALGLSKKFIADAKETRGEDHLQTVQIFDLSNELWAKGNGTMFSTNGTKAFYFYSEAFEDKGMAIHAQHIDRLTSFLGKCEGNVEFRSGDRMMFAAQDIMGKAKDAAPVKLGEQVFGWAYHTKTHSKWSYYPLKLDKYILRMSKLTLVNAINYTRTALEPNRDKIRIHYNAEKKEMNFSVSDTTTKTDSFAVPVEVDLADDADFDYSLNIVQLLELIEGVKGYDVQFRVSPVPKDERRPKGAAIFRTIDEFWMDANGKVIGGVSSEKDEAGNEKRPDGGFKCRVTRFMPSKD